MKIVFSIKEDDARIPGVIADCTGDNAGRLGRPSADGFETYGVTGVALITFILLAVPDPTRPGAASRLALRHAHRRWWRRAPSPTSSTTAPARARYANAPRNELRAPLDVAGLGDVAALHPGDLRAVLPADPDLGNGQMWWQLSAIITCGTLAGAIIPEVIKIFTSTESGHVREIVTASREGGASLNILAGLTAGNFSAFWMGLVIVVLMSIGFLISGLELKNVISLGGGTAASVFAFGLIAVRLPGHGPGHHRRGLVRPGHRQRPVGLRVVADRAGAWHRGGNPARLRLRAAVRPGQALSRRERRRGNTFKATAKPVLIGTAVVGATTLIFSIIMVLTNGLTSGMANLSILHAPFLLGLIMGGSVIYWFTGASTQAVSTGAYRAVEFIKQNIRLEGVEKASITDSKRVVAICTQYAQRGMFNIFLTVFFITLAFACLDEFFFIGYLISIAVFGLYQAIFMANAGGAWDNAKKLVEVELKEKGTDLHAATVVGDTVGDPFKDTSSVAMNPIIKFTTLFGLLAVELAITLGRDLRTGLALVFFAIALVFVWRSFYAMRITTGIRASESAEKAAAA
jgi:K(+)-stimulated pyrophosphate-energized sodium pump